MTRLLNGTCREIKNNKMRSIKYSSPNNSNDDYTQKNIARILYALFIATTLFAIWLSSFSSSPPQEKGKISVLVKPSSISGLVEDSTALDFLHRIGVEGVVITSSALGNSQNARDVALASGSEILRLFHMEGIVNIWMWEQIKDKPILPEATYIFTNKLLVFENILHSLTQKLGADKVKSYNDGKHNFGGGIAENYIIEAKVSKNELLSIVTGLDRTYQDTLMKFGLLPVFEVSSSVEAEELSEHAAGIYITSSEAAKTVFSSKTANRIFLGKGVSNPGWLKTVRVIGSTEEPELNSGRALIFSPDEVSQAIEKLKQKGLNISSVPNLSVQSSNKNLWISKLHFFLLKLIALGAGSFALFSFLSEFFPISKKILLAVISTALCIVASPYSRYEAASALFSGIVFLVLSTKKAERIEETILKWIAISLFIFAAANLLPDLWKYAEYVSIAMLAIFLFIIIDFRNKESLNPLLVAGAILLSILPADFFSILLWLLPVAGIIAVYKINSPIFIEPVSALLISAGIALPFGSGYGALVRILAALYAGVTVTIFIRAVGTFTPTIFPKEKSYSDQ